jgi:hypothetical protein
MDTQYYLCRAEAGILLIFSVSYFLSQLFHLPRKLSKRQTTFGGTKKTFKSRKDLDFQGHLKYDIYTLTTDGDV